MTTAPLAALLRAAPLWAYLLLASGMLHWWQAGQLTVSRTETVAAKKEFDDYKLVQERQTRLALEKLKAEHDASDELRTKALNDEFQARNRAEAAAAALRNSDGQLRRYAEDLAASLGRATGNPSASPSSTASPALSQCAAMVGALDDFAAEAATAADKAERAGQLCERHYAALMPRFRLGN